MIVQFVFIILLKDLIIASSVTACFLFNSTQHTRPFSLESLIKCHQLLKGTVDYWLLPPSTILLWEDDKTVYEFMNISMDAVAVGI